MIRATIPIIFAAMLSLSCTGKKHNVEIIKYTNENMLTYGLNDIQSHFCNKTLTINYIKIRTSGEKIHSSDNHKATSHTYQLDSSATSFIIELSGIVDSIPYYVHIIFPQNEYKIDTLKYLLGECSWNKLRHKNVNYCTFESLLCDSESEIYAELHFLNNIIALNYERNKQN